MELLQGLEHKGVKDLRDDKVIQTYLKQKTERERESDEEEEYSKNEKKILKNNEQYAERKLYKKIMELKKPKPSTMNPNPNYSKEKESEKNKNQESDEQSSSSRNSVSENVEKKSDEKSTNKTSDINSVENKENGDANSEKIEDKKVNYKDSNKNLAYNEINNSLEIFKPPFNHKFLEKIDSITFKKYMNKCLEKIEKYWKDSDTKYIQNFIKSLDNHNYFSFLYFSQEPICSLKKDLILNLFFELPQIQAPNIIYQMLKYNYFYYKEFKEITLEIKENSNEKNIFNKEELKSYLKSPCIIGIYQEIAHLLRNKDLTDDEVKKYIDLFIDKNNIFFMRMPINVRGYTIYDGTIFINRNFYDEASSPYQKELENNSNEIFQKLYENRTKNSDKEDAICGFASILVILMREIAVALSRYLDIENNNFLKTKTQNIIGKYSYLVETSAKKFENLLLGESKINEIFPFSGKFNNYRGFLFLIDKENYNLNFRIFSNRYSKILKKQHLQCSSYWTWNYCFDTLKGNHTTNKNVELNEDDKKRAEKLNDEVNFYLNKMNILSKMNNNNNEEEEKKVKKEKKHHKKKTKKEKGDKNTKKSSAIEEEEFEFDYEDEDDLLMDRMENDEDVM